MLAYLRIRSITGRQYVSAAARYGPLCASPFTIISSPNEPQAFVILRGISNGNNRSPSLCTTHTGI